MRDNSWISERIQKETEEFLAKGGKIKVFPPQSFSDGHENKALRDETFAKYTAKKNKS